MGKKTAIFGGVGALMAALGAMFSAFSSADYARHLDRGLHGTHCSFLPGIVDATQGESGCTVAMYSPYSAVLKQQFWGGVPISLFGLGAFAFLLALSLYFVLAREEASRRARQAYAWASLFPVLASLVMLVISLTKLGELCKLCVGIYASSFGLLISAILVSRAGLKSPQADPDRTQVDPEPWHQRGAAGGVARTVIDEQRRGPLSSFVLPILGLGLATLLPGLVYAATLPDTTSRILGCGKLSKPSAPKGVLVKVTTTNPTQPAVSFEDPLCPACKALHERLVQADVYDKLDLSVAIFPLDSECNWMLSRPLHPGACVLSRAFLCGEEGGQARAVLDWSYENQEELARLGKEDIAALRKRVVSRFPEVDECLDSKATKKRLDDVLRFAVENKIRVSTPQLYLGDQRLCDEDTDMGLVFSLRKLSPELSGGGR